MVNSPESGRIRQGGPLLAAWMGALLLLTLLLAACTVEATPTAGPPAAAPAAPAVDTAALRSLVQEAVGDAVASQADALSVEDVRQVVQEQASRLSAEDVRRVVQQVVDASNADQLTADEVESLVQSAVAAAGSAGLTEEVLQQAIAEALDEVDVEQVVADALEADRQRATLTIYSGRSESLVDAIIQQFSAATGIEVEVKYAGTAALAATLQEEGANSPADIFFAQDPGGLGSVEGMLAELPDELLSPVPEWARSPQGRWVGLSGRARTVVYNPERTDEAELPDDIYDFIDPKWRGRIGWAPTNASFQTMVTAMRAVWGEAKTRAWLEGMQANEPRVYPKNTPQVAAAAAGEIDVGLVNHYYLFRFLAEEGEEFAARNYHPRAGGPGATVMVAGAGILESSDNQETAARFIEFMLSRVGQQYFAGQTFEYPLVDGVRTQHVLTPLADIQHPGLPAGDLSDLDGTQQLLRETGILP